MTTTMTTPFSVDVHAGNSTSGYFNNTSTTHIYDNTTIYDNGSTDNNFSWKHYSEFVEYKVADFINSYYLYAILVLGVPGNVACISTLLFMRPMASSTIFMLTLAVVDLVAIVLKMLFFQLTDKDIQLGDHVCQLIFMFGTVSQMYSNWILVAMTMERFIAIWFPFEVKNICSKRNAIIVLSVMLIFFVFANLQFLFTFEEVSDPYLVWDCRPKREFAEFVQTVWYWIDGTLYAFLPMIIMVVFNTLIVYTVRKSGQQQKDLTNRCKNMKKLNEKMSQQRQITVMLLTISIVFIVLTLPNCIFFIVREYWTWKDTMKGIAQYYLGFQVVFVLSDLSHAVNFYLYCLSGRRFRQKFVHIICCRRNQPQSLHSYISHLANIRPQPRCTAGTSTSSMTSISTNGCLSYDSMESAKENSGTQNGGYI